MAGEKNYRAMVKKLKKQVKKLQREKERNKNKLKATLKKARKLGRSYKSKLTGKVRQMKSKIAETQSTTYGKVAANIERQILKGVEAKAKALVSVMKGIEKKHAAKLKKSVAKKGKKVKSAKQKDKVIKVVPVRKRRRSRRK